MDQTTGPDRSRPDRADRQIAAAMAAEYEWDCMSEATMQYEFSRGGGGVTGAVIGGCEDSQRAVFTIVRRFWLL